MLLVLFAYSTGTCKYELIPTGSATIYRDIMPAILTKMWLINGVFVEYKIMKMAWKHRWHDAWLQWLGSLPLLSRHNERYGVKNHQPHDCLLNYLFRYRSKKTSKLRVTGLCDENSPVTGEFPAQRSSNAENVSIWWRHHALHCPFWRHINVSRDNSLNYLCWGTTTSADTMMTSDICSHSNGQDLTRDSQVLGTLTKCSIVK